MVFAAEAVVFCPVELPVVLPGVTDGPVDAEGTGTLSVRRQALLVPLPGEPGGGLT